MFPDLNVCVFAVGTAVTLRCERRFVASKGMVEVLQFKAMVWPRVASESTYEAQKFQNFLGKQLPDPLVSSAFRTASGLKLAGAWVRGYSQT